MKPTVENVKMPAALRQYIKCMAAVTLETAAAPCLLL
jgi:hypothetical protein